MKDLWLLPTIRVWLAAGLRGARNRYPTRPWQSPGGQDNGAQSAEETRGGKGRWGRGLVLCGRQKTRKRIESAEEVR